MFEAINRLPVIGKMVFVIISLCLLIGCGTGGLTDTTSSAASPAGGGGGGAGTDVMAPAPVPAYVALQAVPATVKTGNLEKTTITATVLDDKFAAVKNFIVIFNSSGGQLSDSSQVTDDQGSAKVTLSSGPLDAFNKVLTVRGTAAGISSAPVQVTATGTNLTFSADKTNITSDGSLPSTLTVTAKDGSGAVVQNATITLSTSGAGGVVLSKKTAVTDAQGQISFTVTGAAAGAVNITASGLAASASQAYTVSNVASLFAISSPVNDPFPLNTNTNLTVTVNAPGLSKVRFATTLGLLKTPVDLAGQQVQDVGVLGGVASATFSSSLAGLATIQVSDFNNANTTATLGVVISAPASDAALITLQPARSVVAPSVGGAKNTTRMTATVRNNAQQVVRDAPVSFSIVNPTGGGETIYPVIVYTDSSGTATTTFTSGTQSTDAIGVTVQASIVGTAASANIGIVIGGAPGSVVIGRGTTVELMADGASYRIPMAVQVADSDGNAVQGAEVSLSLWPAQYSSGVWFDADPDPKAKNYVPYITGSFTNEDSNEDMYKNVGEDRNLNGILDPPNSSAGTVPPIVVTDDRGVGSFSLHYVKSSSIWIVDRIRARVTVRGTETTSFLTFRLPAEIGEAALGLLGDSSYPIELTVAAGGTVNYILPCFNSCTSQFTHYSTGSSSSSIAYSIIAPITPPTYSFTAPVGTPSGTVFQDTIVVQDTFFLVTILQPVRIVVQ